jgi:hypothetical protein
MTLKAAVEVARSPESGVGPDGMDAGRPPQICASCTLIASSSICCVSV